MPSSTPGSRLKAARVKLGLTQAGVAQLINQSKYTYQDWERDAARPRSLNAAHKLCTTLHITLDHYIAGSENTALTHEEHSLIQKYRRLTTSGQRALSATADEMREAPDTPPETATQ